MKKYKVSTGYLDIKDEETQELVERLIEEGELWNWISQKVNERTDSHQSDKLDTIMRELASMRETLSNPNLVVKPTEVKQQEEVKKETAKVEPVKVAEAPKKKKGGGLSSLKAKSKRMRELVNK